ncbi:MAG TPA: zinc-binding dehydrogenase [Candidatus Dormibacteraeota bacterium]|nr:zinc-binding dehydrogenase [Candidatus Dormibacteraeota bacterium]
MNVRSQGRAAVFREPIGPRGVAVEERERTGVEPGHVAVAIRAAALNHLDLWLVSGAQRIAPPRVIGADGAGVVAASADDRWKPGDEVVVYPVACCWECEACRAGQQVLCRQFGILGEHTDGTACELLHVPARNLYPRPHGLSWEETAAFPLTFLTAWRMIVTRARLQAGETMLVVGAGAGVAAAAIAIGRHLGARVLATSRSEAKRQRALELGAEATFDSSGFSKAVREASGGGVHVVFEHVGPATLDESIRSIRPGGRVVFCGSTTGVKAEVNMPRLFFAQADLLGSTMGNASEFEAVLDAISAGGLRPSVDSTHPLDDVVGALERLDHAEQFGKVTLRVAS